MVHLTFLKLQISVSPWNIHKLILLLFWYLNKTLHWFLSRRSTHISWIIIELLNRCFLVEIAWTKKIIQYDSSYFMHKSNVIISLPLFWFVRRLEWCILFFQHNVKLLGWKFAWHICSTGRQKFPNGLSLCSLRTCFRILNALSFMY